MPKVSMETADRKIDHGLAMEWAHEIEGYTVSFLELRQDVDLTELLKGLPNDRCQCPHWGYVIKGSITVTVGDEVEVHKAGDAYYLPPGHVPTSHEPGTTLVEFSPTHELKKTEAVMMANMKKMMGS